MFRTNFEQLQPVGPSAFKLLSCITQWQVADRIYQLLCFDDNAHVHANDLASAGDCGYALPLQAVIHRRMSMRPFEMVGMIMTTPQIFGRN